MTAWRVLLARMRALFSTRRLDDDLGEEIQAHLDLLTSEHVRRGLAVPPATLSCRLRRVPRSPLIGCCFPCKGGLAAHVPLRDTP